MSVHLISEAHPPAPPVVTTSPDISIAKIREMLQHRLLHDLVQGESLPAILDTLCRAVQQMIPEVHMSVVQTDSAGCCAMVAGPDLPEQYRAAIKGRKIVPATGSRRPSRRGERAMESFVRSDPLWPEFRALVTGLDYTSVRSIPIKDRFGVIKGTVTFHSRGALLPTVFQWHLLEICTELCALVFERAEAQDRVHFLAHRDPLTGLYNRGYFHERVGEAIRRAGISGQIHALHLIDLDRFKEINDRRGHLAGDRLLIDIARKLEGEAGPKDVVGRLGGDEFVFLQIDAGSPENAARRANRLVQAIDKAVSTHDPRIGSGGSIGYALYPRDAATPGDLLRNADLALYKAKEAGGGRACPYDAGMTAELDRRRGLEEDLRAALRADDGALHLMFQPQLSLADGSVAGVEALVRWSHPKLGPVAPETFIPIAEDGGLIGELGAWVLRNACMVARSWPAEVAVTVNLSPLQIVDGRLPGLVHALLKETGLEPCRLELEITETVLIDDRDTALHALRRLAALGVAIVMDGFGAGYSSLRTLQTFPFDKIKIDRSLIADLETNRHSSAMVDAVLALCEAIGMPVAAEGVETAGQLEILREKKCGFAQGNLFGAPMGQDRVFAGPSAAPGPAMIVFPTAGRSA